MGRPRRYLAAGAYYHVGAKGNNNAPIFLDDWDRAVFVQILKRVRQRYRWRLHARCLLGNHYHLVVETPLANLSDGMRDLNGQYARAFNERHRRVNHVFGKRFWSRVIESEEQYDHTLDYVLHNPINHGFARRLGTWRWTSVPTESRIDSARVARHRQADPSALPRLLPHGGAAGPHRTGREVERRGLLGDVGRGVRAPLLLRPGRADRARRPPPVPTGRVHRRGALHAPLGELLPRRARTGRRRARGPPDRAVRPRGQVRLRRAAAARVAEPRARTAGLRRAGDRDRGACRGARPGLLRGDAGAAREARGRDLQATHDQVPVLLDFAQQADGAHRQPVRASVGQRQLVRDRAGPRPQGHPHLPRVADPRGHSLRDPTRARLPDSDGLLHRPVP